uniref:Death domain-containing protein n=1 Tax=Amblyomma aureolatum TaxID=187763 RepID=A0A1E1X527_9ACAR
MDDQDDVRFKELLGNLRTLWSDERFLEKQDDVWHLLKRDIPRRLRFSCHTVDDLLNILVDREVIRAQEVVFLGRLAAVFLVQEASEHIQAYEEIPLDNKNCSLCAVPRQLPLLYHPSSEENDSRKELVCAILYLCEYKCPWKNVVRAFPKNLNVKEAEIDRLEAMKCASQPGRKRCPTCAGFEVLESWRRKHLQHATVKLLLQYLASERVNRSYAEDIENGFHMSMMVSLKCLLLKSGYERQAQRGESVPIQLVSARILSRDTSVSF